MTESPFTVRQSEKYQGDDWWQWAVWIDGHPQDLKDVEYVEYTLHSTFRPPVRRVTSRKTKFELATSGWGTFTIYVKVVRKGKEAVSLQHDLQLTYPDGTGAEG